jgi:2-(1,2-epoxy-1,2-dihydrophenyl)acetyl-CoA isomerase
MPFKTILLDIRGGVARLTLNRPDRLNAFNLSMLMEMQAALDEVERSAGVRTLLLTGVGRGFCAGQDLSDPAISPDREDVDIADALEKGYNPIIRKLTSLPIPVVCAVNGVAAGAGASVALACDVTLAATSAKFIMSFTQVGIVPDSGSSWALPHLVGQARALGMALTGDPVSAEEAVHWGLIWKAIEDAQLSSQAEALALRFAAAPTRSLAETKSLIRSAFARTLEDQLDLERDKIRELSHSADYKEAIDAFINKRKPTFRGR